MGLYGHKSSAMALALILVLGLENYIFYSALMLL